MVSYLALQPFTSRELKSTYITAIDVETSGSENIAGPYTLDAQQYKLTGTGDKKDHHAYNQGDRNLRKWIPSDEARPWR